MRDAARAAVADLDLEAMAGQLIGLYHKLLDKKTNNTDAQER